MFTWQRPDTVPYPSKWSHFEGKREINGKIPKFWIQDIPENVHDTVVNVLFEKYLQDEPLAKYCRALEDSISVEEYRYVWRSIVKDKMGLMCFMENPEENGEPIIAGLNMVNVHCKGAEMPELTGVKTIKMVGTILHLSKIKDPYEMVNDDKYLGAVGLFVLPEFRGQGIGEELLKARTPLCKAIGIKSTSTVFTSAISQRIAEKVGFQEGVTVSYDELEKIDARFRFPGITAHSKNIRVMYKFIT